MGIEAPAALAALIAAAIPLALHLRSRRAARSVPFPNVELIRELSRESRRERVLADAPLMAARAAAILFAALALSRPYWGKLPPADGPLVEGDMVVMLDRSPTWDNVKDFRLATGAALEARILARRGPGKAVLLPFDDLPGPVAGELETSLPPLLPSGRRRSLDAAFAAAARIIGPRRGATASTRPATVVLLTTTDAADEALTADVPPGVRLLVQRSWRPRESGFTIVDARLVDRAPRVGDKLRVGVRIRRTGSAEQASTRRRELALRLHGYPEPEWAPRLAAKMDLPPPSDENDKELELILEVERARPGWGLASLVVRPRDPDPSPPLTLDDRRFLVIPPVHRLRVLVLSHEGHGSAEDLHALERGVKALAAASGTSRAVLSLEAESLPASKITRDVLEAFDAVVVGDAAAVPTETWVRLREFVEGAGGRLPRDFMPGGGSLLAFAPGEVPEASRSLFGIERLEGRVRVPDGAFTVDRRLDAGASGAGGLARLGKAGFRSYAKLEPSGRTLLAFRTGDPALVEHRLGLGRACLFTAGLGDLADNPSVVVPFVDALLRLAAVRPALPLVLDANEAPGVVCFGGPGVFKQPASNGPARRFLWHSPANLFFRVDPLTVPGVSSERRAMAVLPRTEPGLWRLIECGDDGGSEYVERLIGVNAEVVPEEEAPAPPAAPSGNGGGHVRVVRSREELLEALEGRGATRLAAPLAALALLAMAVELALVGRGRDRSGEGAPSRNGGDAEP